MYHYMFFYPLNLHKVFINSKISDIRGEDMEFFRKHQKIIIAVISLTFLAWTVGLMLLPILAQ